MIYVASMKSQAFDIAIIGGGASGFFGALRAANSPLKKELSFLKALPSFLAKCAFLEAAAAM